MPSWAGSSPVLHTGCHQALALQTPCAAEHGLHGSLGWRSGSSLADGFLDLIVVVVWRSLGPAVSHLQLVLIDVLLKESSRQFGKDKFGRTPFILVCMEGNLEMVKVFLKHIEKTDIDITSYNNESSICDV